MEIFVARQPIFDRQQDTCGYELLFRSGLANYFTHTDGDYASAKVVVNSFMELGLNALTGGRKAFINFTSSFLRSEYAMLFPADSIVVELLENVTPDAPTVDACRKLKSMGYTLALDDFVYREGYEPFINLADIIKVDFMEFNAPNDRQAFVRKFGRSGIKLLAEKVETIEDFAQAEEMGYTYFQGYFFGKPKIVSGSEIAASKLGCLQILQEANRTNLNFVRLEELVKHEVAISYKLLKYINSALFGLRWKIESIKQALVLLGEKNVKKWISLVALAAMGDDKPAELLVHSVVRGRFCESISGQVGLRQRSQDLFFTGLFSLIDAIMEKPMPTILAELAMAEDVKAALLGESNKLRTVFDTALAYEKGSWKQFAELSSHLKLNEEAVPGLYEDAVKWANQVREVA